MNRTQLVGAIAAVGLIVPATALAATINGGPQSERLRGTNHADTINGNGGNDRIRGFGGADALSGGSGNDRVFGGRGNDTIRGVAGNDWLNGGPGDDTIFANRGVDVSVGGDGDDVLWALARADVTPGPGGATDMVGDTLDGGNGDDVLRTRDGEADRITCGAGVDRALLDHVDIIADATPDNPKGSCEIVRRKAPRAGESRSEDREEKPAAERISH